MVTSGSSSNTQCPSGCWRSSSARVATAIQSSRGFASVIGARRQVGDQQFGGAVAGSDGTFDRGRQAGIGPVASEREIAPVSAWPRPACVLLRRGGKRRAALAHDLPPWQLARRAGGGGDFGPDLLGQRLALGVDEAVGS